MGLKRTRVATTSLTKKQMSPAKASLNGKNERPLGKKNENEKEDRSAQ